MTFTPGNVYDCDFCEEIHEVKEGEGMAVKGFAPKVPGAVYARCPVIGVVDLSGAAPEPVGASDGREDWP